MNKNNNVPLWHKHLLTISEASDYFNLGENKLRQVISYDKDADFILYNGIKVLIKRMKFEEYLNSISSI